MAKLTIQNINQGGWSDGNYVGLENSMAEIVNMDIHSVPGLIQVNQKLKKESGTTVDEFCKSIVVCSSGDTYFFGSVSGKIFKRTSAGVYSLVATDANGAILNAIEYAGYIYYFTQSKIGRWKIGDAWSARVDSWNTFSNGNVTYHPATVLNLVLYVGDGYIVSSIREYDKDSCDLILTSAERTALTDPQEGLYVYDTTTSTIWIYTSGAWSNLGAATYTLFVAPALDIEKKYVISALTDLKYQLVIGTILDKESSCKIFRWDTWSISFASEDVVYARGINCFIKTENGVLVSCGEKGDLYTYDGEYLTEIKKIPGNYAIGNKMTVYPNASVNYLGDPLFAVSNSNGNPCYNGIYSFTSYDKNYPTVLNFEYALSQKSVPILSYQDIGAIANYGDNILVAWKDIGTAVGIDTIDIANKATDAFMKTRMLMVDRGTAHPYKSISVCYKEMPTGCSVKVYINVNNEKSGGALVWKELVTRNDAIRRILKTDVDVGSANTVQYKFVPVVSGNNGPEIELIEIIY